MDNKLSNDSEKSSSSGKMSDNLKQELFRRVESRKRSRMSNSGQRRSAAHSRKVQVKYIHPKKGNRVAFSLILTSLILGVSVIASVLIIFMAKELFGIDKSASVYTINIPKNASLEEVVELITTGQEEKNKEPIIKVKPLFKFLAERKDLGKGVPIVPGDHTFSPNMGYLDIIEEIRTYQERIEVQITIPEGKNLYEIAEILQENKVCEKDKFIYVFNNTLNETDYSFISQIPEVDTKSLRFYRMEGYFFPDTYNFYKAPDDDFDLLESEDYEVIAKKVLDNFVEKYTDEIAQKADQLGYTMDEVVTLASIIQAEAKDSEDMKLVSSVLHNRLNNSDQFPKLECSPTKYYSEDIIHLYCDAQNKEQKELAYNTEKSAGLPPGPISNPGYDALYAAVNPEDTTYYFFTANVNRKTVYYASTYEEHQENERKVAAELEEDAANEE